MRTRWLLSAAVVVAVAWWWVKRPRILPQPTELPERVQVFLKNHNLTESIEYAARLVSEEAVRPGMRPGAPKQKKHPIVIVPGITSCGLEVWKGDACLGEGFFRRRIWGDLSMAEAILTNWSCWLRHITLDPVTGTDREGIRVRPAKGLRAADYFVGGYWLWGKMIQNLADIGYDEEDIHLACFDWRLAFPMLEKRDRYFTGLRFDIEKMVAKSGEKVVVLAHSMGSNVWVYFMNWVERAAPGWVDRHVESFVNIAGALLGAMGPLAAFLSGEMDATAALGPLSSYIEALALTFDEAREIYWAMGGVGALLPMGGTAVWGSAESGWTDTPLDVVDYGPELGGPQTLEEIDRYVEAEKSLPLREYPAYASYLREARRPSGGDGLDADDPRRFGNPLASALPQAPNMKIFCFYGVGQPTERAYKYSFRHVRWAFADFEFLPESRALLWSSMKPLPAAIEELEGYVGTDKAKRPVQIDTVGKSRTWPNITSALPDLRKLLEGVDHPEQWIRIDAGYHSNDTAGPWGNSLDGVYANGVAKTTGDSTVPLVSLGYMCSHGWRDLKEFNPAGVKVFTKELEHQPCNLLSDPRGGPASAKHVEIIGNSDLIADVLQIVAGETAGVEQDRIISNISKIGPMITERLRKVL